VNPVLTPQQAKVILFLAKGKTQREIAHELRLSRYRVRVIVRRLCDLYDVDYGWELADAAAERRPEVELPDDGRIRLDGTHPGV
jgi:DNA-binding NarL/FixJ family response regulator